MNVINDILETAVISVAEQVKIMEKDRDWYDIDEYQLWYELTACNLGSRISYEQTKATVSFLEGNGFLEVSNNEDFFDSFEERIAQALRIPIEIRISGKTSKRKYPFFNQKANHIARTAKNIYGENLSIKDILLSSKNERDARLQIISRSIGIGPKQASLFLRNVGYSSELAILDVHVLRYMFFVDILPGLIANVSRMCEYELLEQKLRRYAKRLKIQLASLDIAIWVVMRVYQREFSKWEL
jgi:N-glycosylase/DNA lyase